MLTKSRQTSGKQFVRQWGELSFEPIKLVVSGDRFARDYLARRGAAA